MMTEDEAKMRWCPFARVAFGWVEPVQSYQDAGQAVAASVNRKLLSAECNCLGSACMAWRTRVVSTTEVDRNGEHVERVLGYCGLAGCPDA